MLTSGDMENAGRESVSEGGRGQSLAASLSDVTDTVSVYQFYPATAG